MMEANLVIAIMIMSLYHPSMNALGYSWAYLIMLHPMTMDVKIRFKWGMIYLLVLLLLQIIFFILKLRNLKYFSDSWHYEGANVEQYWKTTQKLLMYGYKFNFDKDVFQILDEGKLEMLKQKDTYSFSGYERMASFDIEIVALIGNVVLLLFNFYHNFKVEKLQNMGIKKIQLYIRLIDPPEEDEDEAGEELPEETIGVNNKMKEINNKREKRRLLEEKLA